MKSSRKWIDSGSIRFKFWMYFLGFSAFILLLLWLLQIVFLNRFYETMKKRNIEQIGYQIMGDFGKEDFSSRLVLTSFRKGIGIRVIDEEGWKVFPKDQGADIFQTRYRMGSNQFEKYFGKLNAQRSSRIFTEKFLGSNNYELVFTGYLGEKDGHTYYLWITTPLEPVESTIDILKNQLVIVSAISLSVALILSFFISGRLARPLVKMSASAKALGQGKKKVVFPTGDYTEVDDLAEALNLASSEIQKTMELRRDLLANVSHDLKTPLTVIRSYGEMIRDISGEDKKLRDRHIGIIIEETNILTGLVNDLLDLSRTESELADLKRLPFSLEQAVHRVLRRFSAIEEKEKFIFRLTVTGEVTIIGDEGKIDQVLYNLISNGINYSGDRKEIHIVLQEKEEGVYCEITDYGIGMTEEVMEKIWERYYRAGDHHQRPTVGTGIGLHIVKSVLDLHGYSYGVRSTVGEGSTFWFLAPYHEEV